MTKALSMSAAVSATGRTQSPRLAFGYQSRSTRRSSQRALWIERGDEGQDKRMVIVGGPRVREGNSAVSRLSHRYGIDATI